MSYSLECFRIYPVSVILLKNHRLFCTGSLHHPDFSLPSWGGGSTPNNSDMSWYVHSGITCPKKLAAWKSLPFLRLKSRWEVWMSPHSTVLGSEDRWKNTKQSNMGITYNKTRQHKFLYSVNTYLSFETKSGVVWDVPIRRWSEILSFIRASDPNESWHQLCGSTLVEGIILDLKIF